MADEQVGTVSVKVIPDTKGFRRKLKAELEAIEKYLEMTLELGLELSKADLARAKAELKALGEEVRVPVKISMDSQEAREGLQRAIDMARRAAEDNPIRPKIRPAPWDDTEFRERLRRSVDEAVRNARAEIPLNMKEGDFMKKLNELTREFDRTAKLKVGVDIDDGALRARLASLKRQITEQAAKIKVDVEAAAAKAKLDAIVQQTRDKRIDLPVQLKGFEEGAAKVRELTRDRRLTIRARLEAARALVQIAAITQARDIDFRARIESSSFGKLAALMAGLGGARSVKRLSTDLTDLIARMDRILPRVVAMWTGLGTLAGVAGSAAGAVLALGKGFVDLSRGALMAPAAFAAAGTAFLILKVAFNGAEEYIGDVISAFQGLAPYITSGFWSKAEAPIRRFSNAFIPVAEKWLPRVSAELGTITGKVADAFTEFTNTGGVRQFFSMMEKGLRNSGNGFKSLAASLLELTRAGSKHFPAMGRAFTSAMGDLEKWTRRITSDGTFDRWMKSAGAAAKDFGRIIGSTGSILRSFTTASLAAGGPTLKSIADGFDSVARSVRSARGMEFLTTMFRGAYQSVRNLAPGLRELGSAFVDLGPAMSKSMAIAGETLSTFLSHLAKMVSDPRFGAGMVRMMEGFRKGVELLEPVFQTLGADFGMLMSTFGLLAENIGRVVGTASRELGVLFQDLLRIVDAVIPVLSDYLVNALEAVAPVIRDVAGAVRDFAEANPKLFTNLLATAAGLGIFARVAGIALRPIVGIAGAVSKLKGVFGKLPAPLSGAGGALSGVGRVMFGVGKAALRLGGWVTAAVFAFKSMWDNSPRLQEAVGDLWEAFKNLGKSVAESVGPGLKRLFETTLPKLADSFAGLMDAAAPLAGLLGDGLAGVIENFTTKVELATPAIAEFAEGLVDGLNNIIDNISTFTGAFSEMIQGVEDLIDGNWAGAWEHFKTASTDALSLLPGKFGEVLRALQQTVIALVDTIIPMIIERFQAMVDGIGIVFSTLAETVLLKLGEVVTAVHDWAVNFISGIVQTLSQLPAQIAQVFTTVLQVIIASVSQWFTSAIQFVILGIAEIVQQFYLLVTHIPEVLGIVAGLIAGIVADWFITAVGYVTQGITLIVTTFQALPALIAAVLASVVQTIITEVTNWFTTMSALVVTGIATVVSAFGQLVNGIRTAISGVKDMLVQQALSWFGALLSKIGSGRRQVKDQFSKIPGETGSAVGPTRAVLLGQAAAWFGALVARVSEGVAQVVGRFGQLPGRVIGAISGLLGMLIATATAWMAGMGQAVTAGITTVVGFFQALPGRVVGALAGAAGQLYTVGVQMMQGLISGIMSMASSVASKAASVVKGAIAAAKGALGIASPSKVFRQIGVFTGEGYIRGMDSMRDRAMGASRKLVTPPSPVDSSRYAGAAGAGASQEINVIIPERENEDPSRTGRRVGESIAFELGKWV